MFYSYKYEKEGERVEEERKAALIDGYCPLHLVTGRSHTYELIVSKRSARLLEFSCSKFLF